MRKLITSGCLRSMRKARFTLTLWLPDYRTGCKSIARNLALSSGVKLYLRVVLATCPSGHGSGERAGLLEWVTWWTFKRFATWLKSLSMLSNTSLRAHRTFKLKRYAVSRQRNVLAGYDLTAMLAGRPKRECFARTCQKAKACMMLIENCKYPLNTGKTT